MPRPLQRVRLESGLKLNLNSLARRGLIKPGAITGPVRIAWTNGSGQEIASGYITADMSDERTGWLRIRLGQLDQCIYLVAPPASFRRSTMVLRVPASAQSRDRAVDAPRRRHFRVPKEVGQASRLRLAIYEPHRQGSSGRGDDQIEALLSWWLRPRRMGFAAKTEMDEVENLQSNGRKI